MPFDSSKFIKGNGNDDKYIAVSNVVDDAPKKRGRKKKNEVATVSKDDIIAESQPLSYCQSNEPYANAFIDTNRQLDEAITQLDILTKGIVGDMMTVKASKTLKNKYTYITNMTETASGLINAKIGAIKEKNKTINDINNFELKKVKELKLTQSEEDDNQRIMSMYDAFINTPIGNYSGANTSVLGPSIQQMTIAGNSEDYSHIPMGNNEDLAQQNWEGGLDPAQKRMLLESQGRMDTVVMYDGATGNRWFEVIDKTTGQPISGVEKPDSSFIYDLDINERGGFAKDINRNVTYPLIVVNNSMEDPSLNNY